MWDIVKVVLDLSDSNTLRFNTLKWEVKDEIKSLHLDDT